MKIKCEDCIFKCEDPEVDSGWLDPMLAMFVDFLVFKPQTIDTHRLTGRIRKPLNRAS